MVHENMVDSTQSLKKRQKACEYFSFDFIPRDLKSCVTVKTIFVKNLDCQIMHHNWIPAPSHDSSNFLEEVDVLVGQKHRYQRLGITLKSFSPTR